MRRIRGPRRGGALVVSVLVLAGCGGDSADAPAEEAPPDVVAVVDGVEDGAITQDELDDAIVANAELNGQTPPVPETPEYGLLAGQALDQLILERWVAGEAAERGVAPESLQEESVTELQSTWGPRTECPGEVAGRLCGDAPAPANIPPASG